jgi:hypothetical protein
MGAQSDATKLVLGLAIWLCLAIILGLTGLFQSASASVVVLTVWTLTALVLVSWWKIPAINRWTSTVDLSRLIALHLSRFVGIYFLWLCPAGELSCSFANPAGIGDVTIAIGATILLLVRAVRRHWRNAIFIWNALGSLDIVLVVFRAFRVGLVDWSGMAPLRALPLMLLPTFLVPLIIACHIVIFVRLAKRRDVRW